MDNFAKQSIANAQMFNVLLVLIILTLISSPVKAQNDGWKSALVVPGSQTLAVATANFPECLTVETYFQKNWYHCDDTTLIAKMSWDTVWSKVHKDFDFTIPEQGRLYVVFTSKVAKDIFYYGEPTVGISYQGKDGKWQSAWLGGAIRSVAYHGGKIRYVSQDMGQSGPPPIRYKINADGTVKIDSDVVHYGPGRYRLTIVSATRFNDNTGEKTYVPSNAEAKVIFIPDEMKLNIAKHNPYKTSSKKCCNVPKGHKLDKDGCPSCPPGMIYDPDSRFSNKSTGCGPKVAVIFTTFKDPHIGEAEAWSMADGIVKTTKRYNDKGYRIINIDLTGTITKVGSKSFWTADIDTIVKYLTRPSTKAIAYFGHGGQVVKKNTLWWDTYTPSLDGHTAQDFFLPVYNKIFAQYSCLSNTNSSRRAAAKANNIGLEDAYIFACHSLDDNSLRNFLISESGYYWGDTGTYFGLWELKQVKGRVNK